MCWLLPGHRVPLCRHKWGPWWGAAAPDPPSQVDAAGKAVPAGMGFTSPRYFGHHIMLFMQVIAGVWWQGLYSVTGL